MPITVDSSFSLRALDDNHQVHNFTCGRNAEMDSWFQDSALGAQKANLTTVYALADPSDCVAAFFTLSGYCLETKVLANNDRKSFVGGRNPRTTLPAHFLGRIAVAEAYQGGGVGALMMKAAFINYQKITALTTSNFLCLDAKNAELADYYKVYGFKPTPMELNPGQPIPMYLKSSAITKYLAVDS